MLKQTNRPMGYLRNFLAQVNSWVKLAYPKNFAFSSAPDDITDFIRIFITFSFLFLCCPFRLIKVKDEETHREHFVTSAWSSQKFLCDICTIINFLWMIYWIRACLPKPPTRQWMYIDMFKVIIRELHKLLAILEFWLHKEDILKLVNYCILSDDKFTHHRTFGKIQGKPTWRSIIAVICLMYTTVSLGNWTGQLQFIGLSEKLQNEIFSIHVWWTQMVTGGRHIFFRSISNNDHTLPGLDSLCGILASFGLLQRLTRVLRVVILAFTVTNIGFITGYYFEEQVSTSGILRTDSSFVYPDGVEFSEIVFTISSFGKPRT